jgi:hypothetical protein
MTIIDRGCPLPALPAQDPLRLLSVPPDGVFDSVSTAALARALAAAPTDLFQRFLAAPFSLTAAEIERSMAAAGIDCRVGASASIPRAIVSADRPFCVVKPEPPLESTDKSAPGPASSHAARREELQRSFEGSLDAGHRLRVALREESMGLWALSSDEAWQSLNRKAFGDDWVRSHDPPHRRPIQNAIVRAIEGREILRPWRMRLGVFNSGVRAVASKVASALLEFNLLQRVTAEVLPLAIILRLEAGDFARFVQMTTRRPDMAVLFGAACLEGAYFTDHQELGRRVIVMCSGKEPGQDSVYRRHEGSHVEFGLAQTVDRIRMADLIACYESWRLQAVARRSEFRDELARHAHAAEMLGRDMREVATDELQAYARGHGSFRYVSANGYAAPRWALYRGLLEGYLVSRPDLDAAQQQMIRVLYAQARRQFFQTAAGICEGYVQLGQREESKAGRYGFEQLESRVRAVGPRQIWKIAAANGVTFRELVESAEQVAQKRAKLAPSVMRLVKGCQNSAPDVIRATREVLELVASSGDHALDGDIRRELRSLDFFSSSGMKDQLISAVHIHIVLPVWALLPEATIVVATEAVRTGFDLWNAVPAAHLALDHE